MTSYDEMASDTAEERERDRERLIGYKGARPLNRIYRHIQAEALRAAKADIWQAPEGYAADGWQQWAGDWLDARADALEKAQ